MITRNGIFLVAFLGFFSGVYSDLKCPGVAEYELSFYSKWSNDTHPNAFPDMGKFSNWVGASHNMYYTMWDAGMEASPGVENVAETGDSTELEKEINMRIMYNKTAWMVIKQTDGPTNGSGAHKTGIKVEVTADYPMVSVISMLVPSPDWFVGIKGVSLCNGGMWVDYLNITSLLPWDAGTDSGDMFNSTDADTDPADKITRITNNTAGTPFMGPNEIATLGMLMFKRVNKPSVSTCSGEQKYELKFEGTWSNDRQPVTTFPANAHFSKLIGCTHKYTYKFWSPMTMASEGVKDVAETGSEVVLYNDLKSVMSKGGYVSSVFKAGDKTDPTDTRTMIITAKDKYSLVSVIAMIAPSPDWFVGVDSVELCGNDGKWKDTVPAVLLPAWDAGTDSGTMFQAENAETIPKDVIKQITKDSDTELKGANNIKEFAKISFAKVKKPTASTCSGEQKYELKFEGMWSNDRQPVTTFPANAHFSKLIGCTHKYTYKFWSPMTMASEGVKDVAETGSEVVLYNDLKSVMSKGGYVSSVFKAGDKTDPTATRTMIITAKDKYSLVSVIAMIAPSPDWFVGVDSVELCGNDGKWKETVPAILLPAWDAGTDSGTMFQAEDAETIPKDVIKQITKDSDTELKGANNIKEFAKISFAKYVETESGAHSISGGVSVCLSVAFLAILRFLY